MSCDAFVATLGWVFEGSPWVAEQAAGQRPFASLDALHRAMVEAVRTADRDAQLALIQAHPDLASRVRLSHASQAEQTGAGLDNLPVELFARFQELNRRYRARFGFPFIIAVRGRTPESILEEFSRRLELPREEEMQTALEQIAQIARFRLEAAIAPPVTGGGRMVVRYGKANVAFYRTYGRPLRGLHPIPESAFTGRDNTLFAAAVDVEVFGDQFLPAYTEGDNSMVVPTDTMKNFVHEQAVVYEGATLEGFLYFLGQQFLATYPQMQALRLEAREIPFAAAIVPAAGSGAAPASSFGPSSVLFSRARAERAMATVTLERAAAEGTAGIALTGHRCGIEGLQLIKITGSRFRRFVRDAHTTLPEAVDRPLFIYLDVYWTYAEGAQAVAETPAHYVAAEQVRDCVATIFHEFVSESIQHLIHEMGQHLLLRFPQLSEVAFEAQNRLWDTAAVSPHDPRIMSYCDPRPPYGSIGLVLRREE